MILFINVFQTGGIFQQQDFMMVYKFGADLPCALKKRFKILTISPIMFLALLSVIKNAKYCNTSNSANPIEFFYLYRENKHVHMYM